MLHLEEYRLVQWGEQSGLLRSQAEMVAGVLHERLNRGLIEETLSELATLLTDADAMKQKYRLEVAAEKGAGKMAPEDIPEYVARGGVLGGAVSAKKRSRILSVAGLFKDIPRKMIWVVADKGDFENLVRKIGFFVQRLVDLLDGQQQEIMRNDIRVLLLNVVALNDKLDELKAIQSSVELVVGHDNPMASSAAVKHLRMQLLNAYDQAPPPYHLHPGGQHTTHLTLMDTPSQVSVYSTSPSKSGTSISGSSLRYEYGTSPRPKSPAGPLNYRKRNPLPTVDPNLISCKSGEGPRPTREIALYTTQPDCPEPIYIEWKSINKPLRSKIRPRVENLAHLLHAPKHPSFRALHCRGFFEDYGKAQYGFVFNRPADAVPNKSPISLLQMFRLRNFLPSQTQRVRLARILASALSQLHSAGWLHKSLRADNILFFPSRPNTGGHKSGISLDEPYLVGYEYARFDGTSEVSEQPSSNPEHDIYRHPLAIGDYSEPFNRLFDIYSLGLIFLEIAHWRPLRKIVSKIVPELALIAVGNGGSASKSSKLKRSMAGVLSSGSAPVPHVPLTQIMKIREWLLDPTTEENMPGALDFLMGEIYRDAVMRCLRGDLVDRDSGEGEGMGQEDGCEDLSELEGARVTEGFFTKVVRELERCVV
ncbi:prion-inhibition and propagation-domain-containing protein [Tirmania nivea]|nr:prion-inhibition and propagation-domain-containing protein [Tirmania nivea]